MRSQGVAGAEAPAVESIDAGDPVHKVVIVGAGIAGLSAALALHRSVPIPWPLAQNFPCSLRMRKFGLWRWKISEFTTSSEFPSALMESLNEKNRSLKVANK